MLYPPTQGSGTLLICQNGPNTCGNPYANQTFADSFINADVDSPTVPTFSNVTRMPETRGDLLAWYSDANSKLKQEGGALNNSAEVTGEISTKRTERLEKCL